ncbi:MAG: hypothetical protein ABI216_20640 [Devosia sp.]
MVARIAPEPIGTIVTVAEFRSRNGFVDAPPVTRVTDDPLPPLLTPVPTPVPTPAIQSASQAFAAALIIARLPVHPPGVDEVRLRLSANWQAPASPLRLADRRV